MIADLSGGLFAAGVSLSSFRGRRAGDDGFLDRGVDRRGAARIRRPDDENRLAARDLLRTYRWRFDLLFRRQADGHVAGRRAERAVLKRETRQSPTSPVSSPGFSSA